MSDQFLALFLTLGLLILLVAWVPFLDFLQHIVRRTLIDRNSATRERLAGDLIARDRVPIGLGSKPLVARRTRGETRG